ncbi:unnamed protein product [Blepharisma stoltei]|uniref:Uncharacterized protein n=1 Tax=Blepharisma stoltei TaxID=1481888 RepID=A0AAU9ITI5_9CILI|nr:unnamed protein product [Blepharisma stoltei]
MDLESVNKILDDNTPFISDKTSELIIKELKNDMRHMMISIIARKSEALEEIEKWSLCSFCRLTQDQKFMKLKEYIEQGGSFNGNYN